MKIEISGQNINTGQSFKNYADERLLFPRGLYPSILRDSPEAPNKCCV